MYKIMILKRASGTEPLWTPYKVKEDVDGVEFLVDYTTNDMDELENTISELLATTTKKNIMPIEDLDFVVDVVINGTT